MMWHYWRKGQQSAMTLKCHANCQYPIGAYPSSIVREEQANSTTHCPLITVGIGIRTDAMLSFSGARDYNTGMVTTRGTLSCSWQPSIFPD